MEEVKQPTTTDTVTMSIPAEQVNVTADSAEEQKPETLQEVSGESTSNPQEIQEPQEEIKPQELSTEIKEKPQRNEKGQFLEGNKESEGLINSGRPCDFCREPFKIMQKVQLYIEYCQGNLEQGSKKTFRVPYLEELAEHIGILTDTIDDWVKNEKHQVQHTEFVHAIKRVKMLQRLRLQMRSLNEAPAGAIFLLKANHGFVETEKQILAGSNGEPIEYNIHIVPKKKREELDE